LFSRVGAADDLARGRSTFMVEMVETAAILNQADDRALVILDEIGRGTATWDGLSIAWATLEHLHAVNRCRALFATHYHELTALAAKLPGVENATVTVKEWEGEVHVPARGRRGAADRSYGVQVARLAGLPPFGGRTRQGGARGFGKRRPRGVDWRLVASDDGSTDDSPAILARFAATHPGRVRRMQGPRQGTTANFLALLATTGADDGWLAFSDQDDIWLPDKLARATATIKAAEVGLWTAQVTLCDENGRVLGSGQTMPERPDFGLLAVEALAGGNTMVLTPPAADLLRRALAITPADLLRGGLP
jgi:hypothetical protein